MRNKQLEYISAEVFATTLKEIKAQKGLKWREMAVITGRSPGTLSAFAHGKREFVLKNTADDVIRRLSGEPLPPTLRQQAEYTVLARKTQSDQRTETLQSKKLGERKAQVAELRRKLRSVRLDESKN